MILYILYRIAFFVANLIPTKVAYKLAGAIAFIQYVFGAEQRRAIIQNLKVITGGSCDDKTLNKMARDVFKNFAKYLVDFFRFQKIDDNYISSYVSVPGIENIDKARESGNGVIALSAHIGNWELGGFVLATVRPPLSAVALTHKNKKINDFFTRQRQLGKLQPIKIGISLRSCYTILKNNGSLALLGDRDFSNNGMVVKFFGRDTLIPKGPAVFSYRLGSPIVPCFMIRNDNDTFTFFIDKPLYPDRTKTEEEEVKVLMQKYTQVIESYVKTYPRQWYMFREVWNGNAKNLRPDTIV